MALETVSVSARVHWREGMSLIYAVIMFNEHWCNTNKDRGGMFKKKTMNIILLHQSSRQDYLNTITHLQEMNEI